MQKFQKWTIYEHTYNGFWYTRQTLYFPTFERRPPNPLYINFKCRKKMRLAYFKPLKTDIKNMCNFTSENKGLAAFQRAMTNKQLYKDKNDQKWTKIGKKVIFASKNIVSHARCSKPYKNKYLRHLEKRSRRQKTLFFWSWPNIYTWVHAVQKGPEVFFSFFKKFTVKRNFCDKIIYFFLGDEDVNSIFKLVI